MQDLLHAFKDGIRVDLELRVAQKCIPVTKFDQSKTKQVYSFHGAILIGVVDLTYWYA